MDIHVHVYVNDEKIDLENLRQGHVLELVLLRPGGSELQRVFVVDVVVVTLQRVKVTLTFRPATSERVERLPVRLLALQEQASRW